MLNPIKLEVHIMPIPPVVAERLTSQGIDYQIIEDINLSPIHQLCSGDQVNKNQVVNPVVLEDSLGKVQILTPSDCLLDLPKLWQDKGRDLLAVDPSCCADIARSHGLEQVSAIPLNDNIPLMVDKRLLTPETLFVEVDNSGHFLKLSQGEFGKLIAAAESCDCCVPLARLSTNPDDRAAIESSVQQFTQLRLKRRLEETLEMPPLPETAEQIIQLRIDPEAGVADLAALVEKDPSLAAQVVSWASSPYYAAPGAISSVHDAVIRVLGFELVINLALGLALGKSLALPKDGPHGVTPYWQESVFSAAMSEGLVSAIPGDQRPSLGLAYLSGLLSNYGYLILAHIFPPHFAVINRAIEANPHLDHHYIEQHILGLDRETLSSQLMECWNMPDEVVKALRWQYHPNYDGAHAIYAKLLYASKQLLRSADLVAGPSHPLDNELFNQLGLAREDALWVCICSAFCLRCCCTCVLPIWGF